VQIYRESLDTWLGNLYFEMFRLPLHAQGQREHEVDLLFPERNTLQAEPRAAFCDLLYKWAADNRRLYDSNEEWEIFQAVRAARGEGRPSSSGLDGRAGSVLIGRSGQLPTRNASDQRVLLLAYPGHPFHARAPCGLWQVRGLVARGRRRIAATVRTTPDCLLTTPAPSCAPLTSRAGRGR